MLLRQLPRVGEGLCVGNQRWSRQRSLSLSAIDGPPSPGTPLLHLFSLRGILKHLCSCPSVKWLLPLILITWNSERIGSKSHLHLGFHEGPLSSFLSWNRECLTLHHIFLCTFIILSPTSPSNTYHCPRPEQNWDLYVGWMYGNKQWPHTEKIHQPKGTNVLLKVHVPSQMSSFRSFLTGGAQRWARPTQLGEDWWSLANSWPKDSVRWPPSPSTWITLWWTSLNFCVYIYHIPLTPMYFRY